MTCTDDELEPVYVTAFRYGGWTGDKHTAHSVVPKADMEAPGRHPGEYRARRDADFLMALLIREPEAAYGRAVDLGLALRATDGALS